MESRSSPRLRRDTGVGEALDYGASGNRRARFDAVKLGRDFPALAEQVVIGLEPQPKPFR